MGNQNESVTGDKYLQNGNFYKTTISGSQEQQDS